MKKRIAAVMVCLAVAAISISGTMAYFTADEIATNVITSGKIDIDLQEWSVEDQTPYPKEKLEGIMPGDVVSKIVKVENKEDSADAYVRIKVTKKITAGDTELDADVLSLDFNRDYWIEKDGYFYYIKALAPGEKTEPLFRTVTFAAEDMDNDYQNGNVEIIVEAEAVQAKNQNVFSATQAKGWLGDQQEE